MTLRNSRSFADIACLICILFIAWPAQGLIQNPEDTKPSECPAAVPGNGASYVSACQCVIRKATERCDGDVAKVKLHQDVLASSAAKRAADSGHSVSVSAEVLKKTSRSACAAQYTTMTTCETQGQTCENRCAQIGRNLEADSQIEASAKVELLNKLVELTQSCVAEMTPRTEELRLSALDTCRAGDMSAVVEKLVRSGEGGMFASGGWLDRNKDLLIGGGAGLLAGGVGTCLLMGCGGSEKEDNKGSNQSAADQQLASQAFQQVPCSGDDAVNKPECEDVLMNNCSQGDAMKDNKCGLFANRYCGMSQSTGVKITNPQAPGVKSHFCNLAYSYRFCAGSPQALAKCPSCQMISQRRLANCQENPALCLSQNSARETARMYEACKSDPYFAYFPVQSPSDGMSPSPQQQVNQGDGQQQPSQQNLSAPVLPTGVSERTTAGLSPTSVADVDTRFGPSLFATASGPFHSRCQSGLFRCGLKSRPQN